MMTRDTRQLTTVQFKKHKAAYTVAGVTCFVLAVMFYFVYRSEGTTVGWAILLAGLLLSVYCFWNGYSDTVVLELSTEGIKYKQRCYPWDTLQSYAINVQDDGEGSFTYLVLNFKNAKVPLTIQLDWIDDEASIKQHMAIFAKAYEIEFDC
ncbi:hypothetical protein [Pedobacter heparinus]|uniref:hypothetical protein n=1 Tax=Pedobacter heparinus TaxID=984 RepID=UPI00292E80FB|nr:hypothetical protein [Pedobacter heparinus]